MTRIKGSDFINQFRNQSLDVQDLQGKEHGEYLQKADKNNDGVIQGTRELQSLFSRIDRFDTNGTGNSIDVGTAQAPTASGEVYNMVSLLMKEQGARVPSVPAEEPRLKDGSVGAFQEIDGPAFVDGASFRDVDQGSIGDCWMMAGLAAVAAARPEAIEKMIQKNDDGTFTVTLHDKVPGNPPTYKEHQETVRPTFPKDTQYADPSPGGKTELWVALVEKAYAQWKGNSYENLVGGYSNRMMSNILGEPNKRYSLSSTSNADSVYNAIHTALEEGHPVTSGTPKKENLEPLKGHHGYAVIDAYERDGEKFIKVYNPWGYNDTDRDMTVEVPLDKFISNSAYYAIAGQD